jgi:hypothetical protein
MVPVHDAATKEAVETLEKMSPGERAYVLYRLVRDKLEGEPPGARVAVESPDGTIYGYIQLAEPPTPAEVAVMQERAQRIKPGAGAPMRSLLERTEAGDEAGVRKFIIHERGYFNRFQESSLTPPAWAN